MNGRKLTASSLGKSPIQGLCQVLLNNDSFSLLTMNQLLIPHRTTASLGKSKEIEKLSKCYHCFVRTPDFPHEIQCSNDVILSKQCIIVKMLFGLKCQNGTGISKLCRYNLSKWRRFANGFQQNTKAFRRNKSLQQAKQVKRVYKTSVNP